MHHLAAALHHRDGAGELADIDVRLDMACGRAMPAEEEPDIFRRRFDLLHDPLSIPWPQPPTEKIFPDSPRLSGKISTSDIIDAIVSPIKRKNVTGSTWSFHTVSARCIHDAVVQPRW